MAIRLPSCATREEMPLSIRTRQVQDTLGQGCYEAGIFDVKRVCHDIRLDASGLSFLPHQQSGISFVSRRN